MTLPIFYASHATSDHFRGVTKMVELGNGAKREIDGSMLTQHNDKPPMVTNPS